MTQKSWTTWEEWYSFTQENGRNLDDPFPDRRITENIPEMQEVIALLDQAIESDSNEACFQSLIEAVSDAKASSKILKNMRECVAF